MCLQDSAIPPPLNSCCFTNSYCAYNLAAKQTFKCMCAVADTNCPWMSINAVNVTEQLDYFAHEGVAILPYQFDASLKGTGPVKYCVGADKSLVAVPITYLDGIKQSDS